MFEAALVESSGKLKSQSRYWMIATLAFNLAIVAVMILIPLLHPEALPRTALTATLVAPPPPPAPQPIAAQVIRQVKPVQPLNAMVAPARVPRTVDRSKELPPPSEIGGVIGTVTTGIGNPAGSSGLDSLALTATPVIVIRPTEGPKQIGRINISSGVAAGALLSKTTPVYPAIAKAARVSGAVVLHAIISKHGTIESLQVVSGPEMLRGSALDAVHRWRYKPYLLNGEPTEVETSITVNFTIGS